MIERIRAQLEPAGGGRRADDIKFTIQRDGRITDAGAREIERLPAPWISPRSARSTSTRQLPPLPARFPTRRSPFTSISIINDDYILPTRIPAIAARRRDSSTLVVGRFPPLGARDACAPSSRRRAPAAQPTHHHDHRRRGRAAAVRGPRFHRAVERCRNAAIARTIGQVLFDDLDFEREFALMPRDIYATIPAGTSFERRAVRSLARAERRRP